MPLHIDRRAPDFDRRFTELLAQKREVSEEVAAAAAAIIADVRKNGDAALVRLSARFDAVDLAALGLAVSREERRAALAACPPEALAALRLAKERVETYHLRQKPKDERFTDALGVSLGWRWTAVQSAGLYVPGGSASYPSSVLMNAVPAKVAGVPRVVMVVPAPRGEINPLVLAA
ncbi:MAG: histidinol dehydrogenase, partial [Beijerinckiaceae bacterium]